MKYHIEKNTVQETLVIPLYGRKMCSELYPNLFRDETAMRLIEEIDYDFSTLAKRSQSMMRHAAERPRLRGEGLSAIAPERGGREPRLRAGRHGPRL